MEKRNILMVFRKFWKKLFPSSVQDDSMHNEASHNEPVCDEQNILTGNPEKKN